LAARASIAVLVVIGCYAVVDLGVGTGSSDGCEDDGGELHFCCCILLCCVLGFFVLKKRRRREVSLGFVGEKFL
jgi:hypothetical protein